MAGMKPGFITGANAKIKAGNITLAYATDVSYDMTTITIPVEVMGRYEVVSNEPIAYGINGSFSVVRYTSQAASSNIAGVNASGNSSGSIQASAGSIADFKDHLNPGNLLMSTTFDLQIYQKTQTVNKAEGPLVQVFNVKDVRLTRKGATLSKRGILVDTYAFVGILGDDAEAGKETVSSTPGFDQDLK